MSFSINPPFSLPDDEENTTVYPFSIQGIDFWGTFSTKVLEANPDLVAQIYADCGVKLSNEAYQFKFDRMENIESDDLFARKMGQKSLSHQGVKFLETAIVQCFELHHQLTHCNQYYALALEEKRARFYTRIAQSPKVVGCGFHIRCGLGNEKLAYLITRSF
jgi:hypothetical protein